MTKEIVKAEPNFGLHIWIQTCFGSKGCVWFLCCRTPTSSGEGVVELAASRRALGRVANWKFTARKPEEP